MSDGDESFAVRTVAELYAVDIPTARAILNKPWVSHEQAEDAAANAMARLIADALTDYPTEIISLPTLVSVCRLLLRGDVAEVGLTRQYGGYCLRPPSHLDLLALGHLGAKLVELSYTVKDPARAWAEATDLWGRLKP